MSILWCGGEEVDFPTKAAGFSFYTASSFRAGYARGAITATNSNTAHSRGAALASPVTTIWASTRGVIGSVSYVAARFFGVGRSGKTGALLVGGGASVANKLTLWACDESGTYTALAAETGTSLTTDLTKWDMKITSYGASGNVKIYKDGSVTPLIDYTGDLTWASGPTDLDTFVAAHGTTNSIGYKQSECILADEDTRTMSLVTLYPTGAGDANTLGSGLYSDVDEDVLNDADLISSDTTGQAAQFALSDLPSGTFAVKAVKTIYRGVRGATGIQKWKQGIKSGGTIDVAQTDTMDTAWASYERLMLTNPVTTNTWTQAEIDALQIAVESLT